MDSETLRRQFQAASHSLRHDDGGPIHQLRQLLRWPRERFDAVLEAFRADHHVDLAVLTSSETDAHALADSYQVPGQCYGRLRWRD